MSCWVVPAIAAELWGVPVSNVLSGVRDGSVPSREEHGFVFVDVAPDSQRYYRPRRPGEPPPATFVAVSRPECGADEPPNESPGLALSTAPSLAEDAELPPLDDEEDDSPLPPRDAVRASVARQRRRPLAA